MVKLTLEDKKGLLVDARSKSRKRDFKKLNRSKYHNFNIKLLEELTEILQIYYPRTKIKADKNKL